MDEYLTDRLGRAEDLSPYRLDGVNLVPYLKSEKQGAPHDYLFWRYGPNAAVRKGPWKLLMCGDKLTRLYNVDRNPGESNDLSSERPTRLAYLGSAQALKPAIHAAGQFGISVP